MLHASIGNFLRAPSSPDRHGLSPRPYFLWVFLRTGSSHKAAGEELHLHTSSVKYRVHRAVERRGRPINDDRLDVEVAPILCEWFGTAVLR